MVSTNGYNQNNNGFAQPQNVESSEGSVLFFHEVKSGDTLGSIAAAYNVKVAQIVKWNMLNSDKLTVGSKIKIYIQ